MASDLDASYEQDAEFQESYASDAREDAPGAALLEAANSTDEQQEEEEQEGSQGDQEGSQRGADEDEGEEEQAVTASPRAASSAGSAAAAEPSLHGTLAEEPSTAAPPSEPALSASPSRTERADSMTAAARPPSGSAEQRPASSASSAAAAAAASAAARTPSQGPEQRPPSSSFSAAAAVASPPGTAAPAPPPAPPPLPPPEPLQAAEDTSPEQSGPHYQRATQVMPKPPLQEYKNADSQHINSVFSTGTALGRGIRSLPDAFSPDFRQRLYEEALEAGRRERSKAARGPAQLSSTLPLAPGQRQVHKVHPYAGTFTAYEYMPSEYDRKNIKDKFERLQSKVQQVAPNDFIVKAPPLGPKGAPAFSEFEYDLDPIMNADTARSADNHASRMHVLSGPFLAGGRIDGAVNLRGLADECMLSLCKQLSRDWPLAFLQVFEDSSGAVVLCFDKIQAVTEGDLSSYMQNMVKTGRLVAEFRLVKDGAQWGLMDDETMSSFFVFWPPWVRHRFLGAAKAAPTSGGNHAAYGKV